MKHELLYIHGFGGHKNSEQKFLNELEKVDIKTHSIDLRGFGENHSKQGYIKSITDFRDDIDKALLDFIDDSDKILLGYSLGGLVSLHYFLKYNHSFDKLILFAPAIETYKKYPIWSSFLSKIMNYIYPQLSLRAGILGNNELKKDPLFHDQITPRLFLGIKKMQKEVLDLVKSNKRPIYIFHSKSDTYTKYSSSKTFSELNNNNNIELITIEDKFKHALHKKDSTFFVEQVVKVIG
ncbi:MAG: alpha/beta fold hydrolase [Candidatus Dojkabacteria bacterium]|nr:alpha/beta fold hydrolase [Candidatus Dojkabacteria bacterium]MDQ7020627.1 alpha/beta fold hydrolase [Candidatus Dojkabacteria bacterium]